MATSVGLSVPAGVAIDSSGNVYIADTNNNLLEKVDTSGKIKVIAGGGTVVSNTSGTQLATSVSLNQLIDVKVDASGNVYISDQFEYLVEKVDTAGKIKVIVGNSVPTGVKPDTTGTQNATSISLNAPREIAVDSSGNLYISDTVNNLVAIVDIAGKIKVIAGNSFTTGVKPDTTGTQSATSVSLNGPFGVAVDNSGNVYIAPQFDNLVEKIDTAGKIKVIAGNSFNTGVKADTTGTQNATSVSLNRNSGLAVDNSGNVYIADRDNFLIEKVDTAGKIKVIAGNSFNTGVKADTSGTQNATSVSLYYPVGVTVDGIGNIYIADQFNHLVEKIDTAGKIKVIAGGGTVVSNTSGTQLATSVGLSVPAGVAIDSSGNVYIADTNNNLLEKVDTSGKIKVIAGGGTVVSNTSGTQLATSVSLNQLIDVKVDASGNVYISDQFEYLVEKVDTAGKIKVIVGNSVPTGVKPDTTGTQNATSISLNAPREIAVDSSGNLYISDTVNNLVAIVVP